MNKKDGIRADKLLVDLGYAKSRERAKELIKLGYVFTNNSLIKKPSKKYSLDTKINITNKDIPWVSRAGLKLEKALELWSIKIKDAVCLDIGASTGGFTQVLLHYKAKTVYALDVGHSQMAEELKNNPRVIVIEKTNVKEINKSSFPQLFDFISADVSFISLEHVLPKISILLKGESVVLVKPQFEIKENKGIITNPLLHKKVIEKIKHLTEKENLKVKDIAESPIKGSKGNKEYLFYLSKK